MYNPFFKTAITSNIFLKILYPEVFCCLIITGTSHRFSSRHAVSKEIDVNWEQLMSPASKGMLSMSQLLISASHIDGININHNPGRLIQHPESFRASLTQISKKACICFMTAHNKMDNIRTEMVYVPEEIQKCVEIIQSGKKDSLEKLLPNSFLRIQQAVEKCSRLANQVANDFDQLIELIGQVLEATSATISYREQQFKIKMKLVVNENIEHLERIKEQNNSWTN